MDDRLHREQELAMKQQDDAFQRAFGELVKKHEQEWADLFLRELTKDPSKPAHNDPR
jgi:hypothetical protein